MTGFFRLVPFLIVLIVGFAFYQLYFAYLLAMRGEWPFAALYLVMAMAGGALARALWVNRQKVSR